MINTKGKTFSLTTEETGNLDARISMMRPYDYVMHLILEDIENYKRFVIAKRLGVEGKNFTISKDNKVLTLVGGEDEKK
ncbi:MAG: hypothetical protein NUV86_09610 [Candidatus Scalindua sp.]|nr:hypothetical protein [Candidatus Scalindua sp.]